MLEQLSPNVKNICIHTGNILTLNEVKMKAGQTPTDELIESLKITLNRWQPTNHLESDTVQIFRVESNSTTQANSEERKDLKFGVKIFISSMKKKALYEALETMFLTLNTDYVESLVLAYPSKADGAQLLSELQEMWVVLEEYVENKKLLSIGVSDVETELFIQLHTWAKVKPSIIQINLASCCVVPPPLQEFTKQNDVQLLTHSDPFEILPRAALNEIFGAQDESTLSLNWALRFQVHVKCRGVLSSKGYILFIHRS